MVVAALGTVLAAGYLLWLLQRAAFGTPKDEFAEDPNIHDTTKTEWIAWAPLLALILALGIYPNLVFRTTDGAVDASLTPCLTIDVNKLSHEEIKSAHCPEVYGLEDHDSDHHAASKGS